MRTVLMLLASMALASAQAQQNPGAARPAAPRSPAPSSDQLEPAVDTTATTTPEAVPAREAAAASTAGATPGSDSAAAGKTAPAPKGSARAPKGPDRVELETTEITGNRELPKVLYIVPWKRSDLGDLVGKPANSLLDEVLQPIDRDVFLRENRYYDAVKPDAAAVKPGTVPGSGGKP
jgi:hypothetical protein